MRNKLTMFGVAAMLAGCGASQNEPFSPAAPVVSGNTPDGSVPRPPMIPEAMHTIRGGTKVTVRTTGTISAGDAAVGQTFHAVFIGNVLSDDNKVAIPRGSEAMLAVKAVNRSELSLDLDSVTVNGRRYRLETDNMAEQVARGGTIPADSILTFRLESRVEVQPD